MSSNVCKLITLRGKAKIIPYTSLPQASLLWELTRHMGSHSVTRHTAEVTFTPLLQQSMYLI